MNMIIDDAIYLTNTILQPHCLSHVQDLVFRQCWEGKTYSEIASISDYNYDYLREMGAQIWQMLSKKLGVKVTKSNLRSILIQHQAIAMYPVQPIRITSLNTTRCIDWGDAIDISFFYRRELELATLEKLILGNSDQKTPNTPCRMISLLGMEGIGKTSLAVKIAQQVQDQFDFLIWRSLRNIPLIENILPQWIQFLSHQEESIIPNSIDDKILRLLHYLRISRCLLVLDNFESILQFGDMRGHYRDGYEGYGQLLRIIGETNHQSCLIITTREKPIGLEARECKTPLVRSLQLTGLECQSATQHYTKVVNSDR